MGSSLSVTNKTDYNLHICLKQATPLYFENFVKPGQTFKREVGKVWFTIEARIGTHLNEYSTESIVLSIGLISLVSLGSVAVAGALAGVGAFVTSNDGSSIVCSHGWYAGQNRRFEIRQRLVEEMDIVSDGRVNRFRGGKIVQFYLVEV